ncbi:ABC transporter substrate-binding protein [Paenibacillus glufosinatiresistens]|uniref:ABC transporter substrate-binding protein n=1 Tax=Paenibacillus glufosinatiresistens TaxID=3070657 RepID=UPI00286E0274|nr:ABC transporter substrate-binding protein [Paenibacillus sp. YX.27]
MFKFTRSRKSRSAALAGVLMIALLASACGNSNNGSASSPAPAESPPPATAASAEPQSAGKTVTDAMGHEVKIPANPQKVLASYLEDYLVTLGVTPVAQWSVPNGVQDYLSDKLSGVPTISYDLPLEAVISFAPDLILIGSESAVQNGLYDQYSKVAPTYVLGDETGKDWRKALTTIGGLLGRSGQAEAAIAEYDRKAADAKAKLAKAVSGQSAAVVWLVQKNFYLVDETQSSGSVLYRDLGLTPPNLVTDIPEANRASWNPVTLEKLAELKADHLFLVNSDKTEGSDVLNSAIWKGIPAVKAGHVYELEASSSWLYNGPTAGSQVIDDVLKFLVK